MIAPAWCIRSWFPGQLKRAPIETSEPVKATLIRSIRRYSEDKGAAQRLAADRYDRRNIDFERYQAHTRQAIAYYEAADGAHYRVTPLLYYYSFSNFAEALVALARNNRPKGAHGLELPKSRPRPLSLLDSTISLKGEARFQALYVIVRHLLRQGLGLDPCNPAIPPPTEGRFCIRDLCAYVSDVNHEFEHLLQQPSPSRFATCKLTVLMPEDRSGYQGWMAVTLCGPDCTPSPTEDEQIVAILKGGRFLRAENFDEECVMRIFGFTLERSKQYSFWRTRQGLSDVEAVVNEVASGLGEHLALLPFPGESVFRIDLDYRLHRKQKDDESINDTKNDDKSDKLIDNNDYYDRLINDTKYKNMVGLSGTEKEQLKQSGQIIRMNEFLAIYLIMYALSMIVRYYPEKWEQMLLTEVGYIIEGFVKSAPVTFLRYYRNLLDGECWMVSPR